MSMKFTFIWNNKFLLRFLLPLTPSGAEALPPAWNECDGVHQSHPHPEDQSGTRLRPEGTDQRTGELPSNSVNEDHVCMFICFSFCLSLCQIILFLYFFLFFILLFAYIVMLLLCHYLVLFLMCIICACINKNRKKILCLQAMFIHFFSCKISENIKPVKAKF